MQEGQLAIEVRVIVTLTIGIKRPGLKVTNSTRVCSAHFAPGCFIPYVRSPSLVKPAAKERRPLIRYRYTAPSLASLAKIAIEREFRENDELESECTTLKTSNSQLLCTTSTLNTTICRLESQLSESSANMQQLQARVRMAEMTITELTKMIDEFDAMRKRHEGEVEELMKGVSKLTMEHECLRSEVKSYERCKFRLRVENFSNDDSGIHYYTGFLTWKIFIAFFNSLEPYDLSNLQYVGRDRTFPPGDKRGPPRALNPMNEFFLTLVRLRLGLQERDLADRFGISQGTVSVIINTWLSLLHHHLSQLKFWPSLDAVKKHMPKEFSTSAYSNTRVIIDATELFIEKPSDLSLQSVTWSNYKSHNTLKGLIGISPFGGVTFCSELWAGSISDIELTRKSGLLDLLESGDNVMADKGFNIDELLRECGVTLNIPPFMKDGSLSEDDVVLTIHVERAIERIKNFRILSGNIPNSIHASTVNKMFYVCAMLTNMQSPLVKPQGSSPELSKQEIKSKLKVSPNVQKQIERSTKEQSKNKLWYTLRSMRLTSSNFGRVFKRRVVVNTLAKELLSANKMFTTDRMPAPLKWGIEHESVAYKEYVSKLATSSPTLQVTKSGLWIDLNTGWLACSPDGLVWDGNEQLVGILEIKCPYSAREMTISEACQKISSFLCLSTEGGIKLAHSHNYYYQVQGSLPSPVPSGVTFMCTRPLKATLKELYPIWISGTVLKRNLATFMIPIVSPYYARNRFKAQNII